MRIGLISDIHGNLVALEAVLADIDQAGVDQIICLGDVAALGPQPCEVAARLRTLGCACIMGNHDLEVLNPDLVHQDAGLSPWEVELVEWCVGQLSEADVDYLRSFRPLMEMPLAADGSLLCFHGSPRSHLEKLLATTPTAELDEMLAGHAATVMAGGHTHVQMLRQHKGLMVVNPGSIGFPLEEVPFEGMPRYLPWAEYAIIDWVDGVLGVEFRRVSVDLGRVKHAALTSGMPRAASWLELWTRSPLEKDNSI
jgi:predicted phosphodiesterase